MKPLRTSAQESALGDDAFLHELNALLEEPERRDYRDLPERYPTVHVLGVPRSGTTLALQTLAACTDVAYVDHVAAAFWCAPVMGLRLSATLRRNVARPASFASDFGRTGDLAEPHEFHYLWARLLGTPYGLESLAEPTDGDRVDWAFFRRVLVNMTHAVGRPLALKSFHAIWHLPNLCRALRRAVVVRVRRDPLEVAQSLLSMRERLHGSREAWASIKPKEHAWLKDEDFATQIAGQIAYVSEAIEAGLAHVGREALVDVRYEDLCADPGAYLEQVAAAVQRQGGSLRLLGAPAPFPPRHVRQDGDAVAALREALARFHLGCRPAS